MSNSHDDSDANKDLPNCPNCGSSDVEATPDHKTEYQCLACGEAFDEGGRAVTVD